MAGDAGHAGGGVWLVHKRAALHAGRRVGQQARHGQQERDQDEADEGMSDRRRQGPIDGVARVASRRAEGVDHPDQPCDRGQGEQARIGAFAYGAGDRVAHARAGDQQVQGQKRGHRDDQPSHERLQDRPVRAPARRPGFGPPPILAATARSWHRPAPRSAPGAKAPPESSLRHRRTDLRPRRAPAPQAWPP